MKRIKRSDCKHIHTSLSVHKLYEKGFVRCDDCRDQLDEIDGHKPYESYPDSGPTRVYAFRNGTSIISLDGMGQIKVYGIDSNNPYPYGFEKLTEYKNSPTIIMAI